MPRTPHPTRRRPLALLALALAGCVAQPTQDQPRSLAAPVHSARRFWDAFLAPSVLGERLRHAQARGGELLADETDLGTARATLAAIAGAERDRPAVLADDAGAVAAAEARRLGRLPASPALDMLSPPAMAGRFGHAVETAPAVAGLDRRILGEPDDYEHRTDPADDRPEAGWLARILRRILP